MAKILLVEDDINLREIYAARLQAENYEVAVASDGEEALAMVVEAKPDLMILDVMMPKISGFDVLDILRSTPETEDTPVIMLTALSQDSDRERGKQLNADKYLVKSQITLEDVVNAAKELLGEKPEQGSADEEVESAGLNQFTESKNGNAQLEAAVQSMVDGEDNQASPQAGAASPQNSPQSQASSAKTEADNAELEASVQSMIDKKKQSSQSDGSQQPPDQTQGQTDQPDSTQAQPIPKADSGQNQADSANQDQPEAAPNDQANSPTQTTEENQS